MKRRDFLGHVATSAAIASAVTAPTVRASALGANGRVNLGWIGCGGRGQFVARRLLQLPGVAITAVCDVYDANAQRARQMVGPGCDVLKDFRHVLDGTLLADRLGFEIFPELRPGQKATEKDRGSTARFRMKRQDGFTRELTGLHTKNFIECIRSRRQPVADIQLGYQASTAGHLANIAYRTGHKLHWDSARGEITNDQEASKLLTRKARKPWDLI